MGVNLATFSPNARIQALTREQLLALIDLFGMNKRNSKFFETLTGLTELSKRTHYADLSAQRTSQSKEGKRIRGMASKDEILVDHSVVPTMANRVNTRAVIGHESIHMLGERKFGSVGNNELLTANAVGEYLLKLKEVDGLGVHSLAITNRTQRLIEDALEVGKYMSVVNKNQGNLRSAEYNPSIGGNSFSELGKTLGALALKTESELHIPGIGLFVIREVSKGQEIRGTIENAKKGKFNRELNVWLARHPSVCTHILRTAHPKNYERFVKYVWPKLTNKPNPIKPRKKMKIVRLHKM